jgi:site-specific DNA-cytosine methylase
MSISDMFKTIGNGVPFLVANSIAASICDYLKIVLR